ncbi:MAG TPA: type II secretion system protein GspK [Syntrophales bacterium]|nr:type II secretion system protein GspK [Syntrophales bacterium]HPQ44857.1 type II secretion system protein GspK [Syntrophales bacterium]
MWDNDREMRRVIGNEEGIALFLVLWVLALLTVIVGEFCYTMRTEANITRNFKEETEAYYIAEAGLNRAIVELIRNERIPQKVQTSESEEEEVEERLRVNTDIPPVSFGGGQFKVHVASESGKINLNTANNALLKMILSGFGLEDENRDVIVDSILDWRDKDQFHRVNGAEDDYYRSLSEPYECRDGDFQSVEELLLVRGVTPELFYGGLEKIVTVYGEESTPKSKTKKKTAEGKININAADYHMLISLPGMTEDLVRAIIDYRKVSDFKKMSEVIEIVGPEVYKSIKSYITMDTIPYFTITSVGTTGDGKTRRGVEAFVKIDVKAKKGYRVIRWLDNAPCDGFSEQIEQTEADSRGQ